MDTYDDGWDVCRDGLEVLEAGGPGHHHEVEDEEEYAEEDAEAAGHPGQDNVLPGQHAPPGLTRRLQH